MPKNIIAANWKMNNDEYASKTLTYDFLKLLNGQNNHSTLKLLCVPYPYLSLIDNMCKGNESVKVVLKIAALMNGELLLERSQPRC